MKAVLLAGGLGSRISEETAVRPKPMIEIGGQPILWHIMNIYAHHGVADFIICLGYKGYVIKEYFANYVLHRSDVAVDLATGSLSYLGSNSLPPWKVTLIDTGPLTMTGGRLKRIRSYLPDDEPFCMTYGDGVADVDVKALVSFHRERGLEATVTTVSPPSRYGVATIENDRVVSFAEKPAGEQGRINGGFFVLQPQVLDRIAGDETVWEAEPLESLAAAGQLAAYSHDGFWHPMDTLRDKSHLENLWATNRAPWKIW